MLPIPVRPLTAAEASAALCRGRADVFDALPGTEAEEQACAECMRCPIRLRCAAEGVHHGDRTEIRGGWTGHEREQFMRAGLQVHQYPPHGQCTYAERACVRCSQRFTPTTWHAKICLVCRAGAEARMLMDAGAARV